MFEKWFNRLTDNLTLIAFCLVPAVAWLLGRYGEAFGLTQADIRGLSLTCLAFTLSVLGALTFVFVVRYAVKAGRALWRFLTSFADLIKGIQRERNR